MSKPIESTRSFWVLFPSLVLIFILCSVGTVFAGTSKSVPKPTIESINYTAEPLVVGEKEKVQFAISEKTAKTTARDYYVELYAIRDGVSYLKDNQYVTIPAKSSSKTVKMTVTFDQPGSVFTKVVVYSLNGTKLVERTGKYADSITDKKSNSKWYIEVLLPKNRNNFGTITLYDADGSVVRSTYCLGLSQYDNDGKGDPLITFGNTPTGTYDAVLGWPRKPSNYSYGPYKNIILTGVSGQIIQSKRSDILIHGGDPSPKNYSTYPLRPTNGCVRITNSDMNKFDKSIENLISNGYSSKGTVKIIER